eukprot:TRINITY_DN4388_c0_g1_i1.p1 TRINITY_DN4388_c0_g1~~TRINITY_DN4388_c0_g1_i1.p1  ORF type:complete len:107 (+),score=23.82 TRINITY_DN4388_c0_g1_i1:46-321(+)
MNSTEEPPDDSFLFDLVEQLQSSFQPCPYASAVVEKDENWFNFVQEGLDDFRSPSRTRHKNKHSDLSINHQPSKKQKTSVPTFEEPTCTLA